MHINEILVPDTEAQLKVRHWRLIGWIAGVCGGAVLTGSAAFFVPDWHNLLVLATLLQVGLIVFAWLPVWLSELDAAKPLDGQGCLRLQALAGYYPEIVEFLTRVREAGRPVCWGDLWRANGWLTARRHDAERSACRALNGLEGGT